MAKYLNLNPTTGDTQESVGTSTSAGSADAGKLVQLGADGKVDPSILPNSIGADSLSLLASESISAGSFVNIFNDGGTAKIRNASATAIGMQAHGYVIANVASGVAGTVYFDDSNSGVTGQTPGQTLYLSATTPGATTNVPPTTAGQILQKLGVATSTTAIHVLIDKPIVRA